MRAAARFACWCKAASTKARPTLASVGAEPVFAYYRAFDDVFEAEDAMRDAYGHGVERMLMLGGGGFAYPKFA